MRQREGQREQSSVSTTRRMQGYRASSQTTATEPSRCSVMARRSRTRLACTVGIGAVVFIYLYLYGFSAIAGTNSRAGERQPSADDGGKLPKVPLDTVLKQPRKGKVDTEQSIIQRAKNRLSQYCNPLNSPTTGEEGQAPEGYKLKHVHAIIRHGARSSRYRLDSRTFAKLSCVVNSSLAENDPLVRSYLDKMNSVSDRDAVFNVGGMFPQRKNCKSDQLTGMGAVQHLRNGDYFTKVYIDKWKLLNKAFDKDEVLLFTTKYTRTQQSAVALLYGLLPTINFSKLSINYTTSKFCSVVKRADCVCRRLPSLYAKSAHASGQYDTQNRDLLDRVKRSVAAAFDLSPSELPGVVSFADFLNVYVCHTGSLPCSRVNPSICVTWQTIDDMWRYLDGAGAYEAELDTFKKVQRLAVHPLVAGIHARMRNVTLGRERSRFVLYSGHEVTITPLAVTLGFYRGIQPRFGARIVLELYKGPAGTRYYVRVVYDGRDMTKEVPFCKGALVDGLCPFKSFTNFVLKDNLLYLGGDTYSSACEPQNQGKKEV